MSNETQCILNANPDICGIGVRVSIYIQSFLDLTLTILAFEQDQLATTVKTTLITATSLILSGFIQFHLSNGLSLFEADVVTQLISIKLAGIIRLPRSYITIITHAIYQVLYVIFVYWVWSEPGKFGSQPDCNGTVVWAHLFGHIIYATDRGVRIFVLIFNTVFTLYTIRMLLDLAVLVGFKLGKLRHSAGPDRLGRLSWPDGVNLGQFGVIIYLIVVTELSIQGNRVQSVVSQWSFGQTLSVLLVLPSLLEVCERVFELLKVVKGEKGEKGDIESHIPTDVEGEIICSGFGLTHS